MKTVDLNLSRENGIWIARDEWIGPSGARVTACFAGKGLVDGRRRAIESLVPADVGPAWVEQIHSDVIQEGQVGSCGPGDALISHRAKLALSVVTADCVPVLLAGGSQVAAVHAGWKGVVAEIVAKCLGRFRDPVEIAWIGPSIRKPFYEVSVEVADQVVSVSSPEVRIEGPRGRPHVDLADAVAWRLQQSGVAEIRRVADCTFAESERLWSYRREGSKAGRNLSLLWRH